eukprot:scaffold1650_cov351-Prasinococcus_capsulatus_cf.AAC.21
MAHLDNGYQCHVVVRLEVCLTNLGEHRVFRVTLEHTNTLGNASPVQQYSLTMSQKPAASRPYA